MLSVISFESSYLYIRRYKNVPSSLKTLASAPRYTSASFSEDMVRYKDIQQYKIRVPVFRTMHENHKIPGPFYYRADKFRRADTHISKQGITIKPLKPAFVLAWKIRAFRFILLRNAENYSRGNERSVAEMIYVHRVRRWDVKCICIGGLKPPPHATDFSEVSLGRSRIFLLLFKHVCYDFRINAIPRWAMEPYFLNPTSR